MRSRGVAERSGASSSTRRWVMPSKLGRVGVALTVLPFAIREIAAIGHDDARIVAGACQRAFAQSLEIAHRCLGSDPPLNVSVAAIGVEHRDAVLLAAVVIIQGHALPFIHGETRSPLK